MRKFSGHARARPIWALVLLLAALALLAGRLRAQPDEPSPMPPPPANYYAAGNHLEIRGPILGDAVLAGRVVEIRQAVDGDVLGAGWRVKLSGAAHDDVRIAGGDVRLEAPIDGDVTVGGGDVTTRPQVRVAGRAWVSGATVRLEGTFARDVRIAGRHVQLGADVTGPVEVAAEQIEILPGARLRGPLTYRSPQAAAIAPGAILEGPVTFKQVDARDPRQGRATRGVSSLLFGLHVFVTGLLVIVLVPRVTLDVAATLRRQPGRSLVTGLALLVTLPIAAMLLMISILGLPLGVAMVALYLVALLVGLVTTALVVGQLEAGLLGRAPASARGSHAALLMAGVVTLTVLRSLPVVGGVVVFASVLFGLGALTLWTYRRYELSGKAA
ncbi:MAG TPA: polymer-forming cytoskeletal protein [Vicinamibacterales bacterium]|nr:polymer-forming cytoskeletal protein [Vicinamibacterales bacterium]